MRTRYTYLIVVHSLSSKSKSLTFCLYLYSKILTVSDDSMLKLFSIGDDGAKYSLNEESLHDLDEETFTICSNQVDTIAFGGSDNKVHTQKITVKSDEEADDLDRE